MKSFEAVLFDLDGVLVDSEGLSVRVMLDLLTDQELPFTTQEFTVRANGSTFQVLYDRLEHEFGWKRPDGFDLRVDAALAEALGAVEEIEGARRTLLALSEAGVPFAVASNSRRDRLALKLRAARLADVVGRNAFDPSHVGGVGKPDPALYRHAALALGVRVEGTLVVEDSVPGVRAGVAAGATVWGLLPAGHVHPAMADDLTGAGAARVLRSHAELRGALGLPTPTS